MAWPRLDPRRGVHLVGCFHVPVAWPRGGLPGQGPIHAGSPAYPRVGDTSSSGGWVPFLVGVVSLLPSGLPSSGLCFPI